MSGPVWNQHKRDANEPGIRGVVEEAGGSFEPHSNRDGPDAFVGYLGMTEPWEIKNGNAKLRPGQKRWAETWQGRPVQTVRTEAHARKRLRMMRIEYERRASLSSLLRAQRDEAERTRHIKAHIEALRGGGVDQALEDHEDATAERDRTKGAA